MKSILYVGVTLMIGASIYGFVDYKKTSRDKEFKKMYDSKETTDPVVTSPETNDVVVKKDPVTKEKIVVSKKQPVKKEEIQINSSAKEFVTPVEKIEPETSTVNTSELAESNTETKYKAAKKKKLNYRLFSRAPLEEKYIDKELKLKPGKPVKKEQ